MSSLIKLFLGVFLFVGLPLLGWGMNDWQDFITHPARFSYLVAAFVLQIIVVFYFLRRKNGRQEDILPRERLHLLPLQIIPLLIFIIAPYTDHRNFAVFPDFVLLHYLGTVLFAVGFFMAHWAEASLGKQFSIYIGLQENHVLVTEGIYCYIRHPRYLGIITFTGGFSLLCRSWIALVLVSVLVFVLLRRASEEEAILHRAFGVTWEQYVRRSSRFIPFVY